MAVKSLGKGIGALIPDFEEPVGPEPQVAELSVDSIRANRYQPRKDFDEVAMMELVQSIREKGIVQPVTVREVEDGYELVAGERRLRAVRELNLRTIPAYVLRVKSDEDLLEMALVENLQREDLNPIDLALAYRQLINDHGLTQEELADKVGKYRSTVANMIRLLTLPEEVQEKLKSNEITAGHGRAILTIHESEGQAKLLRRILNENLSVRQAEEEARRETEPAKKAAPSVRPPRSPQARRVESELMERLGTKVKLQERGKGGAIVIEYYSPEDLDRLLELFGAIEL